jgi:nicotinamidase/pyrazinamidase
MTNETLLVDVDTQHDFCHPEGALFVRGADAIVPTLAALVRRAREANAKIIGSVDSHAFDAWEFAGAEDAGPAGERPGFPPHCVKGTAGWLKVPCTLAPRARFIPNVKVRDDELVRLIDAHAPEQILLEKEVYSLFANPNADAVLARLIGDGPPRFVVCGVALDYCVKAATLGLLDWLTRENRRGEVLLVRDAVASVVPDDGPRALEECRARGAIVVDAKQALAAFAS